jgi:transcriptional antiterminator RfaH
MEQWYVLYTLPNAERHVASRLEGRGIEVYLPEICTVAKNKKGKLAPFFPCYLFIHIELDHVASSLWQWTPGLRYMVSFGGEAAAVPDQTITLLQRRLEELNKLVGQPRPQFKPGDVVRITDGPFADMVALFEGPSKPTERVTVLLNFLGQFSRVKLDVANLENGSHTPATVAVVPQKRQRRSRGHGRPIYSPSPIYKAH